MIINNQVYITRKKSSNSEENYTDKYELTPSVSWWVKISIRDTEIKKIENIKIKNHKRVKAKISKQ